MVTMWLPRATLPQKSNQDSPGEVYLIRTEAHHPRLVPNLGTDQEIWVFRKISRIRAPAKCLYRVLLETMKQFLYEITPRQFEMLIFELFRAMGE